MTDDVFEQVFLSDPRLARVDAEAVQKLLADFPLKAKRSHAWLARAIKVALYTSAPVPEQAFDRPSNVAIGDELLRLAEQTQALWQALYRISPAAESVLMDYCHRTAPAPIQDGDALPLDFVRYRTATLELQLLSQSLSDAGRTQREDRQAPKWRQKEARADRVRRAHCLSSIYETAFDSAPFVNNWEGHSLGNWPDFYQRVVSLVFDEQATPDLVDVLKEARRRHKECRVTFSPGTLLD